MMIRKTIALKDETYNGLLSCGLVSDGVVFSEIVDKALRSYMENYRKEEYKKAILAASKDPLYLADIAQVQADFMHSDKEVCNAV